jgi:NAD(P)-dependent dehydrogenase (short-subunit alcohol dehydrogenase family)
VVEKVVQELGHIDILVNNASVQHYCDDLTNITAEQLSETFTTNVFGYFFFAQVRPLNSAGVNWGEGGQPGPGSHASTAPLLLCCALLRWCAMHLAEVLCCC